jgi:hypothetical protein
MTNGTVAFGVVVVVTVADGAVAFGVVLIFSVSDGAVTFGVVLIFSVSDGAVAFGVLVLGIQVAHVVSLVFPVPGDAGRGPSCTNPAAAYVTAVTQRVVQR